MGCIPNSRWLLETGKFSDFTIICQGTKFPAHKVVLYAQSGYFAALFDSNMKEAQEGVVTFDDIEPELMRHLIEFLYEGEDDYYFGSLDLELCVNIWILTDRVQARFAMQQVEENLLFRLGGFVDMKEMAQQTILDMVFSHTACAKSAIGEMFAEAAWVLFTDQGDNGCSNKIATAFNRHKKLANKMLWWSRTYIRKDVAVALSVPSDSFVFSARDGLREDLIRKKMTEVPDTPYEVRCLQIQVQKLTNVGCAVEHIITAHGT
ncbi:BTB/POZ protein [Colletotrichum cereale]|nr:BTB/POZ protein [Colletotrichum cereale]